MQEAILETKSVFSLAEVSISFALPI